LTINQISVIIVSDAKDLIGVQTKKERGIKK
jgi:hypothetical protein